MDSADAPLLGKKEVANSDTSSESNHIKNFAPAIMIDFEKSRNKDEIIIIFYCSLVREEIKHYIYIIFTSGTMNNKKTIKCKMRNFLM